MTVISIEKTQITSQACEALCYGFLMCTFSMSCYIHFSISRRTTHLKILFAIACAMFIIATGHFAITFYRTLRAMTSLHAQVGGPAAFLGDKTAWHLITADVLYVTQCILGDSIAIYRCWILWDRDLRIVVLPLILLAANIATGYAACERLATSSPGHIFNANVRDWIMSFYALAVVLNAVTTGLMAFRLWWVDRNISDRIVHPRFQSTILLLVESAALYFALQIVVLVAFITRSNIQFILMGSIPPVIGITFTLITIRVGLRARNDNYASTRAPTIGSITMRGLTLDNISFNDDISIVIADRSSPTYESNGGHAGSADFLA
ncbi:hypothetical protein DFH09DRAFT_1363165 [Mycena vulgaris]|nr:hypothetical protein DFH09DRAFT_1363165 [Mycena vulgaris]